MIKRNVEDKNMNIKANNASSLSTNIGNINFL